MNFTRFMGCVGLAFMATLSALAQDFTQSELERMVAELDAVSTRNPKYIYPIKCSIENKDDVNAYASIEKVPAEGEKPQAIMVLYNGLVKFAKGDRRLIRAVIAHEVAHLMQGHVYSPSFVAKDLRHVWDRQQEVDADLTGAVLLEKAGYSKKDMIDMLAMLDACEEDSSWIWRLAKNDHTSAKNRAAEVAGNTAVMRSMMAFEKGLAFLECRRYNLATSLFDRAYALEPKFTDALINAAQASLMDYYDNLPMAVQNSWLRPDFGPVLTDNPIGGRDPEIRDEDRERFKAAMKRISAAKSKLPGDEIVLELEALAMAVDPDASKAQLVQAGDKLKAMSPEGYPSDQIRFANNAGVAYHRAGELQKAYDTLIGVVKSTGKFSNYLAQNVGRFNVPNRPKDDEALVADVLSKWLNNAPTANPYYKIVREAYAKCCQRIGVKEAEIKPRPTYLCSAVAMVIGGKEAPLLVETSDYITTFGEPLKRIGISDQYPDVQIWHWRDGAVSVLTERGQVVKVASHAPGSYVELRPTDEAVSTRFRITVGMSEAEFNEILDLKNSEEKKVVGLTGIEVWSYYPSLLLGVQRKDGKITGIAVSPVAK